MAKMMTDEDVEKCIDFHMGQISYYALYKKGFTETSINSSKDWLMIQSTNPLTGKWKSWHYGINTEGKPFAGLTAGGTRNVSNQKH